MLSARSDHQEVIGMAQLSAAFGQQVALFSEQPFDDALLAQCRETGIQQFYASGNPQPNGVVLLDSQTARALIGQFDRVVRL